MLYIIYGADDYSVHHALSEIKKGTGNDISNGMGTEVMEGNKITFNEFKVACETVPFLADKRTVIVSGLLERFEPKPKPSSSKKAGKAEQIKEWQPFADSINNLPATTVLILVDGEIKRQNPLLKEIYSKGDVKEFNLLKRGELSGWIQKHLTAAGGQATPLAVELMAKLVGSDLWTMSNEINKLISYTSGRLIQEKDVKLLVSHAQEASVFTMVDAIFESKASLAQELIQQLLNGGAAPTYLLTMLSRQIRLAVMAKEMLTEKKPDDEIQTHMGLADFPFRKTIEQAQKYTNEQMKRFYEKLLEADIAIKTGKYGDELALNILVIELCQK